MLSWPVCCLPWLTVPGVIPAHGPVSYELAQKRQTMSDVMGPTGVSDMHCPGIPRSPLGGQFKLLEVKPARNVHFLSMILATTHQKSLSKFLPQPQIFTGEE